MEEKAREMCETSSLKHSELSSELDALRRARDQLRVECSELQSRTNDSLSDDESRRYLSQFVCVVYLVFMFYFVGS